MFGCGRRRCQRYVERGQTDELRKQRDDLLRQAGHQPGDDTEAVDLSPDERAAYLAGRQLGRA